MADTVTVTTHPVQKLNGSHKIGLSIQSSITAKPRINPKVRGGTNANTVDADIDLMSDHIS